MSATPEAPFWKAKPLAAMSREEWEALCDGCGRCCLHKLEDADSGRLQFTNVACRLLDLGSCRCTRYATRRRWVSDCVQLTPQTVGRFNWLPSTCAYRLLAEGGELPDWHPLVCGDPAAVHRAGVSVRGRAISERYVHDLETHIVEWPA